MVNVYHLIYMCWFLFRAALMNSQKITKLPRIIFTYSHKIFVTTQLILVHLLCDSVHHLKTLLISKS